MEQSDIKYCEISGTIISTHQHCVEVSSSGKSFFIARENIRKKLFDRGGFVCGMEVPLWVANRYNLIHTEVR